MMIENTVRQVMPSRVYRHPGGLREERAHLLSESDQSNAGASSAPVQAAAARMVAEMDPKSPRRSIIADDEDDEGSHFTDLTEDAALCSKDPA